MEKIDIRTLPKQSLWLLYRILLARTINIDAQPYIDAAVQDFPKEYSIDINLLNDVLLEITNKELLQAGDSEYSFWPVVITNPILMLLNEDINSSFTIVSRIIDCVEVFVKYVAAILVSDLMDRENLSDHMKNIFVRSLRKPFLGHWMEYISVSIDEMKQWKKAPFVPELITKFDASYKNILRDFIVLRNEVYAHSSTPPPDTCIDIINENSIKYINLLNMTNFLKNYSVGYKYNDRTFNSNGDELKNYPLPASFNNGDVFLANNRNNLYLKLSPLLRYHKDKERNTKVFVFYQDFEKKDDIHYLNYDYAYHYWINRYYLDFNEYFPLEDWQNTYNNFKTIVEERTELFIGRKEEFNLILEHLEKNDSGFLLIEGPPGSGKSSFFAKLIKSKLTFDDSKPEKKDKLQNDPIIISYFIRRSDITSTANEFLKILLDQVREFNKTKNQNFAGSLDEIEKKLDSELRTASTTLTNYSTNMIILIDGLDEALSSRKKKGVGDSLLRYIPKKTYKNIFFLLSSRSRPEVDFLYAELDRERRNRLKLEGLKYNDVKYLLSNVANQECIEEETFSRIMRVSEGNPLFVKQILNNIKFNKFDINNINEIPDSLSGQYGIFLEQWIKQNENILDFLMLLSIAKENFTFNQIFHILNLESYSLLNDLISTCQEYLSINLNNKGEYEYCLFHDTFAEFISSHPKYSKRVHTVKIKLLEYITSLDNITDDFDYSTIIQAFIVKNNCSLVDIKKIEKFFVKCTNLLTTRKIVIETLMLLPIQQRTELLKRFINSSNNSLTLVSAQALVEIAGYEYPFVISFIKDVLNKLNAANINSISTVQVIIEVLAAVARDHIKTETIKDIVVSLCWHSNDQIQMFGIISVFRIMRENYSLGFEILQELGHKCLLTRFIRIGKLKPFIGSAAGIYFDMSDNAELRNDLDSLIKSLVQKAFGLKFSISVLPSIIGRIMSNIKVDYNPVNLFEIKNSRKRLKENTKILKPLARVIELIDPDEGTDDEFENILLNDLSPEHWNKEDGLLFLPLDAAMVSRSIAKGEPILNILYKYWELFKDSDYIYNQGILTHLTYIDTGLKIIDKPKLDSKWCFNAEEIMRHYFYTQRAKFTVSKDYHSLPGFEFILQNTQNSNSLLRNEFIDYVLSERNNLLGNTLLRTLEVIGIEYGFNDYLSRDFTFRGIRYFLLHEKTVSENILSYIIKILSRMQFYHRNEVDNFLDTLPKQIRNTILLRMNKIFPTEDIGILFSMRTSYRYIAALAEPPGYNDGLRSMWQEFLKLFLREQSFSVLMKGLSKLFFNRYY